VKLVTNEIEHALLTAPKDQSPESTPVICKFFVPWGSGTWFITEAEREDDDLRLFGFCDLFGDPSCAELGYLMLSELANVRGPGGLRIERDLYYGPHTLADVLRDYHKL
jgi:hypothetical protein